MSVTVNISPKRAGFGAGAGAGTSIEIQSGGVSARPAFRPPAVTSDDLLADRDRSVSSITPTEAGQLASDVKYEQTLYRVKLTSKQTKLASSVNSTPERGPAASAGAAADVSVFSLNRSAASPQRASAFESIKDIRRSGGGGDSDDEFERKQNKLHARQNALLAQLTADERRKFRSTQSPLKKSVPGGGGSGGYALDRSEIRDDSDDDNTRAGGGGSFVLNLSNESRESIQTVLGTSRAAHAQLKPNTRAAAASITAASGELLPVPTVADDDTVLAGVSRRVVVGTTPGIGSPNERLRAETERTERRRQQYLAERAAATVGYEPPARIVASNVDEKHTHSIASAPSTATTTPLRGPAPNRSAPQSLPPPATPEPRDSQIVRNTLPASSPYRARHASQAYHAHLAATQPQSAGGNAAGATGAVAPPQLPPRLEDAGSWSAAAATAIANADRQQMIQYPPEQTSSGHPALSTYSNAYMGAVAARQQQQQLAADASTAAFVDQQTGTNGTHIHVHVTPHKQPNGAGAGGSGGSQLISIPVQQPPRAANGAPGVVPVSVYTYSSTATAGGRAPDAIPVQVPAQPTVRVAAQLVNGSTPHRSSSRGVGFNDNQNQAINPSPAGVDSSVAGSESKSAKKKKRSSRSKTHKSSSSHHTSSAAGIPAGASGAAGGSEQQQRQIEALQYQYNQSLLQQQQLLALLQQQQMQQPIGGTGRPAQSAAPAAAQSPFVLPSAPASIPPSQPVASRELEQHLSALFAKRSIECQRALERVSTIANAHRTSLNTLTQMRSHVARSTDQLRAAVAAKVTALHTELDRIAARNEQRLVRTAQELSATIDTDAAQLQSKVAAAEKVIRKLQNASAQSTQQPAEFMSAVGPALKSAEKLTAGSDSKAPPVPDLKSYSVWCTNALTLSCTEMDGIKIVTGTAAPAPVAAPPVASAPSNTSAGSSVVSSVLPASSNASVASSSVTAGRPPQSLTNSSAASTASASVAAPAPQPQPQAPSAAAPAATPATAAAAPTANATTSGQLPSTLVAERVARYDPTASAAATAAAPASASAATSAPAADGSASDALKRKVRPPPRAGDDDTASVSGIGIESDFNYEYMLPRLQPANGATASAADELAAHEAAARERERWIDESDRRRAKGAGWMEAQTALLAARQSAAGTTPAGAPAASNPAPTATAATAVPANANASGGGDAALSHAELLKMYEWAKQNPPYQATASSAAAATVNGGGSAAPILDAASVLSASLAAAPLATVESDDEHDDGDSDGDDVFHDPALVPPPANTTATAAGAAAAAVSTDREPAPVAAVAEPAAVSSFEQSVQAKLSTLKIV